MLAFAWPWGRSEPDGPPDLRRRLATSLCAGIGGQAGAAEIDNLHFAFRALRSTQALARAWRPAILRSGRIVAFHGYFDNAASIANELEAPSASLPQLYGLAIERWGDDADRRIIGEYCAIVADPAGNSVRLSRSPLRAPPLHYFHDRDAVAAASVPRALFASGIERRLNETRLADSASINFSDCEASWFENILRVPTGSVVELRRGKPRELRQTYDLFALPAVRMKSDADYIARAGELLDEGVRACLSGFQRPGATLSGGLDSPQVAVRTLRALPKGQRLPTFTFHPEVECEGWVKDHMIGDERPAVEAFAAMHPGLEPHFTANEGYEHDHRWSEFFHLMGGAPSGLCNMYVFHGLFTGAAKAGCDLLLLAEWGNYTFSDKGDWGFVEYLLKGRWRQLWLSWTRPTSLDGGALKQSVARTATAFLPDRLWRALRRIAFPQDRMLIDLMNPLRDDYRRSSGADERIRRAKLNFDRYQPWSIKHAKRQLFANDDSESSEIYQAFEQMYGIAQRDPMAYRPFVEFCFGLPVEMLMRDGTMRWLAKEMAKGIMPEEQRANRLNGRWDADWHRRVGRRRKEYLAELERLEGDERIASMLDLPRLRAALEDWSEQPVTDPQKYYECEFAVPRGLLTARFINYVEGRNTP